MTTYTALCERSDGWWAVTVPEAPGVFTQARRLDHVAAMAREAIALMLDVPADSIDIKVAWTVPPAAADAVSRLNRARDQAGIAQSAHGDAQVEAANALLAAGLTVRDAGTVLGISYQRVSQLASQPGSATPASA